MLCFLIQQRAPTLTHCRRSNHHDHYGDLLRDVSRRVRIRHALRSLTDPAAEDEMPAAAAQAHDLEPAAAAAAAAEEEEEEEEDDDDDEDGDEIANIFRSPSGTVVKVADVARQLPAAEGRPFTVPVRFCDRLGLLLTNGEKLPSGTYPSVDNGTITVFPVAFLASPSDDLAKNKMFRVHARANFRHKPKYSFVEIISGKEPEPLWYAQVWLLFRCKFRGTVQDLALVSYLKVVSAAPYRTTRRTFQWYSTFLDCVDLASIRRTVAMVPSYIIRSRTAAGEVFHLLS